MATRASDLGGGPQPGRQGLLSGGPPPSQGPGDRPKANVSPEQQDEYNEFVTNGLGMIYSERRIAGQREHIVNLSSWYLERRYRGCGLGVELMRSATEDPLRSYHILTSSAKTTGILAELGYRVMDAESFVWRRTRQPERSLPVVEDPVEIKRRVSAEHARLLDDHKGLPVTPRLLADAGEYGLLLFSVDRKSVV